MSKEETPNNIQQFSIYAGKVLDVLYSSFPTPIHIEENDIIEQYFKFNKEDKKNLKDDIETAKMFMEMPIPEGADITKEQLDAFIAEKEPKLQKLIEEEAQDRKAQEGMYQGTLSFLVEDGLISYHSDRKHETGYRLTSKGFLHLNMNFEEGELSKIKRSNINLLKNIFDRSSDFTLQSAAGLTASILTGMLG